MSALLKKLVRPMEGKLAMWLVKRNKARKKQTCGAQGKTGLEDVTE